MTLPVRTARTRTTQTLYQDMVTVMVMVIEAAGIRSLRFCRYPFADTKTYVIIKLKTLSLYSGIDEYDMISILWHLIGWWRSCNTK